MFSVYSVLVLFSVKLSNTLFPLLEGRGAFSVLPTNASKIPVPTYKDFSPVLQGGQGTLAASAYNLLSTFLPASALLLMTGSK